MILAQARRASLVASAALLIAGCSYVGQRDGQDLIDQSQTVYASLPEYPGAQLIDQDTGVARSEDGGGPVTAGGCRHVFTLPPSATVKSLEQFYLRHLEAAGWKLFERLPGLPHHKAGPVLNFVRGRVDTSVNLDNAYNLHMEIGVSVSADSN